MAPGQPCCPRSSVSHQAPGLPKVFGMASFFFFFNVMEPGKSWSWRAERRGWLYCPYLSNRSGLPTSGWALVTAAVEWELHVSGRGV